MSWREAAVITALVFTLFAHYIVALVWIATAPFSGPCGAISGRLERVLETLSSISMLLWTSWRSKS